MEVWTQNSKDSDLGAKDKETVLPLAGLWVKKKTKKLTKGGALLPCSQHPSSPRAEHALGWFIARGLLWDRGRTDVWNLQQWQCAVCKRLQMWGDHQSYSEQKQGTASKGKFQEVDAWNPRFVVHRG